VCGGRPFAASSSEQLEVRGLAAGARRAHTRGGRRAQAERR
jgi:hypothetical protein